MSKQNVILKKDFHKLKEQKQGNYMFFGNIEQIKRQCEMLMEIDENTINELLNNGHDWADDHISVAKENLDQVFDFIMNETKKEPTMGQSIKVDFNQVKSLAPDLIDGGIQISEALSYHITNRKPLINSVFKFGTQSYENLIEEAYELWSEGVLDLSDDDLKLMEDLEFGPTEETNFVADDLLNEAEYQGRKVQLGKIMQGDIKKFKVFVKNDKGKVVKVNFGFGGKSAKGKRMVIKKNNPERRKSFRARHNCDNPGPRWKARYWACRTW
jgi:hypothetical protein